PILVHNTVTNTAGPALVIGGGTGGPTSNASVRNNILDASVGARVGAEAPGLQASNNLFRTGATFEAGPGRANVAFAEWNANHFPASVEASPALADGFTPAAA